MLCSYRPSGYTNNCGDISKQTHAHNLLQRYSVVVVLPPQYAFSLLFVDAPYRHTVEFKRKYYTVNTPLPRPSRVGPCRGAAFLVDGALSHGRLGWLSHSTNLLPSSFYLLCFHSLQFFYRAIFCIARLCRHKVPVQWRRLRTMRERRWPMGFGWRSPQKLAFLC